MADGYERLGVQDKTFLDLERPNEPQHIAAVTVFDAGRLARPDGGVDIQRVRDYVASRLHRLPRYRQRLAWIPVERHPVWVDDPHFQIEYHVRHTALPRPGDERQLKRLTGRLVSQPLDRERPLWEFWVVEGLEGGKRFAIVSKVHHCMIDGIAGVDLLGVLLSPDAHAELEPTPPFEPQPTPSAIDLFAGEVGRRVTSWVGALGRSPAQLREPLDLVGRVREGVGAVRETLTASLRPTSDTPINQGLGPHRRIDWRDLELPRVRRVKDRLGGTVNDVVLATVSGGLRRFLMLRRCDVDSMRIRANVPVSLRSRDERGTLGNHIALLMAELPVQEEDPLTRLAKVRETMAELKESRQALGAEVLAAVSEWTSATLLSLAVRGAARGRPYNLVVTNVPGPQLPLFLLGARLERCYPVVNLQPNQGLGVGLFSYAGTLGWGFTADRDQAPDLYIFADSVMASFEELERCARIGA
jgi:WS/DGAT/MGAT family acyltransferase